MRPTAVVASTRSAGTAVGRKLAPLPSQTPATHHPITHPPLAQQRWLVATLHLITLGLIGLQYYVRTLPPTLTPLPAPQDAEAAWWGLWPIIYLPTWVAILGWCTIMFYAVVWWLVEGGYLAWLRGWSWPRRPWRYLVAGLLIIAFYWFPIQHTRWGDAYILSKAMALTDPTLRLTHSWQAPLDVFLHSRVWQWLHIGLAWQDATGAYRLLSPIAGMIYLGAALTIAHRLKAVPPWLTFGLLTTLGLLQLFFGYIENYSFAAAGILIYLGLGLAVTQGTQPLWGAATALALTNALHPSTLVLAPSLLYLGWVRHRQCNKSVRFVVLSIGLPLFLVGAATIGLMEAGGHGIAAFLTTDRPGGGDARFFVPLWTTTTRWEQYTMFSWPHLRDLLNQQLLVAPVVLPTLLVLASMGFRVPARKRKSSQEHGVIQRFLTIALLSHLLLIWTWNPDYGGQRDWDLFSLALLPGALLLAVRLPRQLSHPRYLQGGAIGLLMLQCFQTAAWIYQNTLPWEWP